MEIGGLQCHGCGSTNVTFDPKRRILVCNQCGKEEYYSRATLNANGKVLLSKENAINFFGEGKIESAQHYALEVLNISQDNAPSLFIIAYYDEFNRRKDGAIKGFLTQVKDIALEYNEVRELKNLILAAAYNMMNYEEEIVELVAKNMQSQEDKKELCEFVDKLCPYLIKKRPSMDFMTNNLVEMYEELAGHCGIPKTCFALLKGMEENPDSPYLNDSFYMKSKTEYFYEHYVLCVGKIINAMNSPEYRDKFVGSYNKKKEQYEEKAGIKAKGVF